MYSKVNGKKGAGKYFLEGAPLVEQIVCTDSQDLSCVFNGENIIGLCFVGGCERRLLIPSEGII